VTLDTEREHITFFRFTAPYRISVLDADPERVRIASFSDPGGTGGMLRQVKVRARGR
jgi:hypothetical protein